jgi:diguanylate cyclase (GGDEF)-like protein/PAS domain S-box-containing protein
MRSVQPAFKPFAARGRRPVAAIILAFAIFSTLSVTLSIRATSRSRHQATVIELAARQRTLAERYVKEVLLARSGVRADPANTAAILEESARALLDGGTAPAVWGDDDETRLAAARGPVVRAQLRQERRLVEDLVATGSALLAHRRITAVPMTAREHVLVADPAMRLRVLAALTSNVSLDVARTIAGAADANVRHLIILQIALGLAGLLTFLLLAWALIAATRRQTAHFRSLVTSSTDLVVVFGAGACRYVSRSVKTMLGRPDEDVLGARFLEFVHPDDQALVQAAYSHGEPHEIVFRVRNRFGEWRHLEAHLTDLRNDRRIRGVVLNGRDVTERVRLEAQLTQQAFHDGLTGLANRALFRDRLDQALARSARSREILAVLLVDLDGFKQVNDSLGHDAGDQLLGQVTERFSTTTRPSDTLARLGGDEFALLLEGADELGAVKVAGRLLESLREPAQVAGRDFALSASIGVVVHGGGVGDREDLIRQADVAMYAAKEAGRGRYEVFRDEMGRQVGEQLCLERELRLGLERGEYSVHYQPEVALGSTAIVGVEALLRWRSPTRGLVPPTDFIPIAEETGMIDRLGEFVLREACWQTAEWRRDGRVREGFVTWVNVSGKQLLTGGFTASVEKALADAALPASFLGLEVTETTIVVEGVAGENVRLELQELRARGVRIAIDDFGTGFSSLGQLRRFPVDLIKIDRSFVQGVEHDAKDTAITANLVSLAHALGLVAIAEGIESDAQLASVRRVGCDLAQGFLFAHPMPARELSHVLAASTQPTASLEPFAASA